MVVRLSHLGVAAKPSGSLSALTSLKTLFSDRSFIHFKISSHHHVQATPLPATWTLELSPNPRQPLLTARRSNASAVSTRTLTHVLTSHPPTKPHPNLRSTHEQVGGPMAIPVPRRRFALSGDYRAPPTNFSTVDRNSSLRTSKPNPGQPAIPVRICEPCRVQQYRGITNMFHGFIGASVPVPQGKRSPRSKNQHHLYPNGHPDLATPLSALDSGK